MLSRQVISCSKGRQEPGSPLLDAYWGHQGETCCQYSLQGQRLHGVGPGCRGRNVSPCTPPAGNAGWPAKGNCIWLTSACAEAALVTYRIKAPWMSFFILQGHCFPYSSMHRYPYGFSANKTKTPQLPGHLHVSFSWIMLDPSSHLEDFSWQRWHICPSFYTAAWEYSLFSALH